MKNPRRLIPWITSYRDVSRYLARATCACNQGRVVFFRYKPKGKKQGMTYLLARYPATDDELSAARASLAIGRVREVRFEDMPEMR